MVKKILSFLIVCGFVLSMYGCSVDCDATCVVDGQSYTVTFTDIDKDKCDDCNASTDAAIGAALSAGGTCTCSH